MRKVSRRKSPVGTRRSKKSRYGSGSRSRSGRSRHLQIYYRTLESGCPKSFLLNISMDEIEMFSKVDCFSCNIRHDHSAIAAEDKRFCIRPLDSQFLSTITDFPNTMPNSGIAVLGSAVYGVYHGKLRTLDLDYEPPYPHHFQEFNEIPAPLSCPTPSQWATKHYLTPRLIPLRGRLYFFGGITNPFGEVYDPSTNSWSPLDEPVGIDFSGYGMTLKASLGNSRGEILLYGQHRDNHPLIFIFSVDSNTWTAFPAPPDLIRANPVDWLILANNPVLREELDVDTNTITTTLYWFDFYNAVICSLNCNTFQFSKGLLVGMEHENLISRLKCDHDEYSFFHVLGDLFCLAWSDADTLCTNFHFTFLRVIESGSLTAYIVSCIQYTADGAFSCSDAVPV